MVKGYKLIFRRLTRPSSTAMDDPLKEIQAALEAFKGNIWAFRRFEMTSYDYDTSLGVYGRATVHTMVVQAWWDPIYRVINSRNKLEWDIDSKLKTLQRFFINEGLAEHYKLAWLIACRKIIRKFQADQKNEGLRPWSDLNNHLEKYPGLARSSDYAACIVLQVKVLAELERDPDGVEAPPSFAPAIVAIESIELGREPVESAFLDVAFVDSCVEK